MSWWALVGSFVAVLALAGMIRLLTLGQAAIDDDAGVHRIARQLIPDFAVHDVVRDAAGDGAILFGPKGVAFIKRRGTHFVAQRLGQSPPFHRDLTIVSVGLQEGLYGPCVIRLTTEAEAQALTEKLSQTR